MLPNRIKLSKKATDKLRYLKGQTGLTPNILSRIAIMLAIREGSDLSNAGVSDNDGQELNDTTLFGEHIYVYDILINQYIYEKHLKLNIAETIVALIEIGVHKIGHVKSLDQLCHL
ncbi:MAG: DndE family protein [Methylovulum sp.]|nr:DndE family protein [Methylovulum sp.]MCF7998528.1 DndE family protein [Methylovulum sp.]